MKYLFILLFPCFLQAQSTLPELILAYEKECAELVPDTIEQVGKVSYDLIPVKAGDVITHYVYGNADTTWSEPDCPEYKHSDRFNYAISSKWYGGGITLNSATYTLANTGPISGSEKQEKQVVKITRQYVCEVKLREPAPFSEHFWNWLKQRSKG